MQSLETLIEPAVTALNFSFIGLEQVAQGAQSVLRLYIEKLDSTSVSIEDCSLVSRHITTILDVEVPALRGKYQLEVSSPGLDRRLFTFEQCLDHIGAVLKVRLKAPRADCPLNVKGTLQSAAGGVLNIQVGNDITTVIEVAFREVANARLVPVW